MERSAKKQSPLEMLVAYQQAEHPPTKATPKDRFEKNTKDNILIPLVEDAFPESTGQVPGKNLVITNSSLVFNFSLNLDPKFIDQALEKSKQVAKGIAAGAAVLGTAFFLGGPEKKSKVRVPLMPKAKVKLPKINP